MTATSLFLSFSMLDATNPAVPHRHEEDSPSGPAAPTTTVEMSGRGLVLATYQLPGGRKVCIQGWLPKLPTAKACRVSRLLQRYLAPALRVWRQTFRYGEIEQRGKPWPSEETALRKFFVRPRPRNVQTVKVVDSFYHLLDGEPPPSKQRQR